MPQKKLADISVDNGRSDDQIRSRTVIKWRASRSTKSSEQLAVEEPLEIRLGGRRFTLTMRTPGHDVELTTGFLFAEGFIGAASEIDEIRHVRGAAGARESNTLDVILNVPAAGLRERLRRNFTMSSSCGVCGKTSIEALMRRIEPVASRARVDTATLLAIGPRMREAQQVFAATGGLHACALFDLNGELRFIHEDVGRHNAVDKVIGHALIRKIVPLSDSLMMVSGRLSFEIVQKAAAAGVPILAAVSAPSSLAVELGEGASVTLIGFLRDGSFNIYANPERVAV